MNPSELFYTGDERGFKQNFVIVYLATKEAIDVSQGRSPVASRALPRPVRDAAFRADEVWKAWKDTIGTMEMPSNPDSEWR